MVWRKMRNSGQTTFPGPNCFLLSICSVPLSSLFSVPNENPVLTNIYHLFHSSMIYIVAIQPCFIIPLIILVITTVCPSPPSMCLSHIEVTKQAGLVRRSYLSRSSFVMLWRYGCGVICSVLGGGERGAFHNRTVHVVFFSRTSLRSETDR